MLGKLRAVMVIAKQGFRDEELFDTKEALEKNDITVKVASTEKGTATGKLGKQQQIDLLVDEITTDDFDAIVFVGGPGMHEYLDNSRMKELANEFFKKGLVTGAICIAPGILANAGILKEKNATAHADAEQIVKQSGAVWTGKSVESDGIIITANGPDAAKEFGELIAKKVTC